MKKTPNTAIATQEPASAAYLEELGRLSTDQLRVELGKALELSATNLMRLALIVRTLEERGEDLSDLRIGLLGYLRQIAYGHVIPEVVVRFAEAPSLVRRIAALPVPDQHRLAAGEPVTLVVTKADGSFDRRMADPLRMTQDQVHQVFGPGRLRDEAEQILRLRPEQEAPGRTGRPMRKVEGDAKRGLVRIGRNSAPVAEVVEALAEMGQAMPETDDPADSAVLIKLTEKEHYSLKHAALKGGTDVTKLVRRTLRAAGLLAGPYRDEG